MTFEPPAPDPAKIIAALDEWEKGDESPGRLLAQLAAEGWTPAE